MVYEMEGILMDLQLYLDKVVYPTLELLLISCKNGEVTKKIATKLANKVCKIEACSLDWSKDICKSMQGDALEYFKSELEKI